MQQKNTKKNFSKEHFSQLSAPLVSGIQCHTVMLISNKISHFLCFIVKKSGGYIIAAFLMAIAIAGPLALKALAAIAGKALIISKIALTIASMIALKKIFSSHEHGRSLDANEPQSIFVDEDVDDAEDELLENGTHPYRYHPRATASQ